MTLINCKVHSNLNWEKYCILAAAGNDANHENLDNIAFNIKDTKLYVPVVVTLLTINNQNYQKSLEKDLKIQCIRISIKQKVITKTQQVSTDIFFYLNLLE